MKSKSFTIEGKGYMVTAWSAEKGLEMLVRLGNVIGEPLALLAGDEKASSDELVGKAVGAMLRNAKDANVVQLVKDCLETTCEGPTCVVSDFSVRFAGNYVLLFRLLVESIRFQYGDFFAAVVSLKKGFGGIPAA